MKRGKAQASFEYVVVYGWALMLILAGVAAFYMLDIGSYFSMRPDVCEFYGQATCVEGAAYINTSASPDSKNVLLRVRNEFGATVNVTRVTFSDQYVTCNPYTTPTEWRNNQILELKLNCTGDDFVIRSRVDAQVGIEFFRPTVYCTNYLEPGCALTVRGKLFTRILQI